MVTVVVVELTSVDGTLVKVVREELCVEVGAHENNAQMTHATEQFPQGEKQEVTEAVSLVHLVLQWWWLLVW